MRRFRREILDLISVFSVLIENSWALLILSRPLKLRNSHLTLT